MQAETANTDVNDAMPALHEGDVVELGPVVPPTLDEAFLMTVEALYAHPVIEENLALRGRLEELHVFFINGHRDVPWQRLLKLLGDVLGIGVTIEVR